MTRHSESAPDHPHSSTDPQSLDLSKYRSAELSGRCAELIGMPQAMLGLILTTMLVGALAMLVSGILLYLTESSASVNLMVSGYALLAGVVLGFILGLLRLVTRSLRSLEGVFRILAEMVERMVSDHEAIKSGTAVLPPPREFACQAYEQVLEPTIDDVIGGSFGLLAWPVRCAYRSTLGLMLPKLLERADGAGDSDSDQKLVEMARRGVEQVSEKSAGITAWLERFESLSGLTGWFLRRYVFIPLWLLFIVLLGVASIPVVMLSQIGSSG